MLCYKCGGTGKYRGNGMMMTKCYDCDENGQQIEKEDSQNNKNPDIDRRSKSYRKAIKEIMDINSDITYKEAVDMFEKAYNKS